MIVLMGVAVFPILYSFYVSLFSLKLTRPHRVPFVWFDNYLKMLSDELFWSSVMRTVSFTVISVATICVLGLLIALDLPRFGGELVAHARPAISNWTGLW